MMMTLSRHFHRMRGCKIMQLSLVAILLVKRSSSGGGGSAERMMSLPLPNKNHSSLFAKQ